MSVLIRKTQAIVVIFSLCVGSKVFGQQDLTAAFEALSPLEQKALIQSAFEDRLQRCHNLKYETEIRSYTQERSEEDWGKILWDGMAANYDRFRIGDSYRLVSRKYGTDVKRNGDPTRIQSGFDGESGISRAHILDKGKSYGRIDTEHDDGVIMHDRFRYWLSGPKTHYSAFTFPYFLSCADDWEVNIEETGLVRLTAPWRSVGNRTLWLDPERNFFPVKGEAKYDQSSEQHESWRTEAFEVKESEEHEGLWMPVRFKEWIGGPGFRRAYPNNYRNVYQVEDVKVLSLQFDCVTPEDLLIEFPPGTKVVDALKAETYFVADDGAPKDVEPVYVGNRFADGSIPEVAPAQKSWFTTVNISLAALVGAFFLWKFARRRLNRPSVP